MISEGSQNKYLSLSFGWGVRLMTEEWYVDEVFRGRITKQGFRALCRALKVPMLEIGAERWVDTHRMELALTSILRIGEPDFFAPGSQTLRHHKSTRKRKFATELDLGKFRKDFKLVVAELLSAKKANGAQITRRIKKAASAVSDRLTRMGIQNMPTLTQASKADAVLRLIDREELDGVGEEWADDG